MRYRSLMPFSSSSGDRCLLSFDFDGTLHDPNEQPSVSPLLFDLLANLRKERKAVWGINTGRSLPYTLEGLHEEQFPFHPDFIIAREREIYYPDGFGNWTPDQAWNDACHDAIENLLEQSKPLMDSIRHLIKAQTGAEWIEQQGEHASLIARTEAEMEWIAKQVEQMVPADSSLGWQRNSIYLRFGHKGYQKGSSLAAVARHFSLSPEAIFAIGDSHNDIEMLDPHVAGMIACPANAIDEIIAHVRAQNGYVSQDSHSKGVIEAIQHYLQP
jgi:HAD superfamily hydrolase (TIGR01484 family)